MTRQRLGAWGVALEDAGLDTALVLEVIIRTLDEDLSWGPDVTTGAIFERAQQFKAPTSEVRFRDVVYSVAFDKVPRRLPDRGR